jgi:hypothetical protein
MRPAHLVYYSFGNVIQDHKPTLPILDPISRNDEDTGVQFGNLDFRVSAEVTHLLVACSGVHFEKSHPSEIRRKLVKESFLLIPGSGIGFFSVVLLRELELGNMGKPSLPVFVNPFPRSQNRDMPHGLQSIVSGAVVPALSFSSYNEWQRAAHVCERP